MLEHWVAVGRPQVVAGRWEARVENNDLIEIRHHSSSMVALNIDLPQSSELQSLQCLVLAWHTQQLGIQAFRDLPVLLMLRLSRFCRQADDVRKIATPVKVT